jgi:hypothetical protein
MVLNEKWRNEVVKYAQEYANHTWVPTEKNLLHGYDNDEILVNTPDIAYSSGIFRCGWWIINQENKGLPYSWGGSSNIKEFELGIAEGKYAGNVPDRKDNGFSKYTVGLDCSGLLAICWKLPKKLSTKELPTIASPLESINGLLPGDILLKPGSHVMIFIDFTDNTKLYANIIDSTRSTGKVSSRTICISEFLGRGYNGYRLNSINLS